MSRDKVVLRKVPLDLWGRPEFRRLSQPAKVAALWVYTGRLVGLAGLGEVPAAYLAHESGLPLEDVEPALAQLAFFVERDTDTDEVFARWLTEWNVPPVGADKKLAADRRRISLLRNLQETRSLALRRAWVAAYGASWHISASEAGIAAVPPEGTREDPSEGAREGTGEGTSEAALKELGSRKQALGSRSQAVAAGGKGAAGEGGRSAVAALAAAPVGAAHASAERNGGNSGIPPAAARPPASEASQGRATDGLLAQAEALGLQRPPARIGELVGVALRKVAP